MVMDGVSGAASVIAVLQISESACNKYIKTVKSARKDILQVIEMVTHLNSTLNTIQSLLGDDGDTEDPCLLLLKSLDSSFLACREAIEDVAKQLGLELGTASNKEPIKITFIKKATWPWKEKDVAKIV